MNKFPSLAPSNIRAVKFAMEKPLKLSQLQKENLQLKCFQFVKLEGGKIIQQKDEGKATERGSEREKSTVGVLLIGLHKIDFAQAEI